jgi:hypothetical protein
MKNDVIVIVFISYWEYVVTVPVHSKLIDPVILFYPWGIEFCFLDKIAHAQA